MFVVAGVSYTMGSSRWLFASSSQAKCIESLPFRLAQAESKDLDGCIGSWDLRQTQAESKDLDGVTVDLGYRLNIPVDRWSDAPVPRFADAMRRIHGNDIWKQPGLERQVQSLLADQPRPEQIPGSPLSKTILSTLILRLKPRVLLEVGVFHGATSIAMARMIDKNPALQDSFVISMDTWLLDARFVFGAIGSQRNQDSDYFHRGFPRLGGMSLMYTTFLGNVLRANVSHRILPIPTTSQNGAMALLAHKIRPDLIYIDASHSNPDVFIDYENFYRILQPGGAIAVDDLQILAVSVSFNSLVNRFNLDAVRKGKQAYFFKPLA